MQGAINIIEQDGAMVQKFEKNYGTVDKAMYSLLLAISGGMDWGELVEPFEQYSAWYRVCFAFYIMLVLVGIMNILTGVLVTRAAETTVLERELIVASVISRDKQMVTDLWDMFQELDCQGSGTVDIDQLTEYLFR